jgi:hypothetical protein
MNNNNFLDLDSYTIDSDPMFRKHVESFHLWFDYLRLSPSFWLAHQYGTAKMDTGTPLPGDFATVLKTYDDFGSVYDLPFEWWWRTRGEGLFAMPLNPRPPVILGSLNSMNERTWLSRRQQLANLNNVQGYKLDNGQDYLLIAVLLDGQEKQALSRLGTYFTEIDRTSYLPPSEKSIYSCSCDRFRHDVLRNHLNVLLVRAEHPEWDSVEISKNAKISHTQPDKLEKIYSPSTIKSMVSRATKDAWRYAENAARGRFPCKEEVTLPNLDYGALWKRICDLKMKDQEFEKGFGG